MKMTYDELGYLKESLPDCEKKLNNFEIKNFQKIESFKRGYQGNGWIS